MLVFSNCGKIPAKINLKEEGFILAHGFRGFSPQSLGSLVSGSEERHNIKVWSTMAHSIADRKLTNKQEEARILMHP
jgi:hypothetical protein